MKKLIYMIAAAAVAIPVVALAQGACGHVHAGDVVHLGVAGEVAVHLAEGFEVLDGEKAP